MSNSISDFFCIKGYKPKTVLVRNGSFVGIYRYDSQVHTLCLWRKINNENYGQRRHIELNETYTEWGSGGHQGITGWIFANEAHLIPERYNLNKKTDLKAMDDCLGGSHQKVAQKLKDK